MSRTRSKIDRNPNSRLTLRELGTIRSRHVMCPCCGTIVGIDANQAEDAQLRRHQRNFQIKSCNATRRFLVDGWRVPVMEVPDWSKRRVSTPSVPHIYNTGIGDGMRRCYRDAARRGYDHYFMIGWHNVPVMTENYFVCELGMFFRVMRALCDDSADFAMRLLEVIDTAYKRDYSALSHHVRPHDLDGAADRREDSRGAFDPSTAIDA